MPIAPAAPTAPMGTDPTAPSATPDTEAQEQYSVTITANGDGTYSVADSDSDDAQDDGQGTEPSGPQSAASIDDALKLAGQMLQEEAGEDSAEPAEGADPQAVWNQLAKKTDAKRGAQ